MAIERHSEDVLDIWQSQSTEGFRMSTEDIRRRIEQMDKKLRRKRFAFYTVCGFLIAFFLAWEAISTNPLQRVGAMLTMLGVGYLAYQVHQNRVRKAPPAENGRVASIEFHRTELERQRDFHRGTRLWSRMLIFVPGPMVFFAGFLMAHPEVATTIRLEAISFVLMAIAAVPLNRWMASKYQRQLDELDRLQRDQ